VRMSLNSTFKASSFERKSAERPFEVGLIFFEGTGLIEIVATFCLVGKRGNSAGRTPRRTKSSQLKIKSDLMEEETKSLYKGKQGY